MKKIIFWVKEVFFGYFGIFSKQAGRRWVIKSYLIDSSGKRTLGESVSFPGFWTYASATQQMEHRCSMDRRGRGNNPAWANYEHEVIRFCQNPDKKVSC